MEFDWFDTSLSPASLTPKEVEESFEDPFSIRLLPDQVEDDKKARYFNLGKTLAGRPLFSVFWTDGKRYRVILAREMFPSEVTFFERKNAELA